MTPAEKFSTTTSHWLASWRASFLPSSVERFSVTPSLLKLTPFQMEDRFIPGMPSALAFAASRLNSIRAADSTRTTSAPIAPSHAPVCGAA